VALRCFHIVCDIAFLTHFTTHFPLLQQQSWLLVHLTPAQILLVTSTLDRKQLPLQQWTATCRPKTGITGWNSVAKPARTPTLSTA
jgi:hypothetical protein